MELPCTLRDGLCLEIRRLSLTRSSSAEEQEERIVKSSKEAVWPLMLMCSKTLDNTGLLLFLPVKGEMPKCSDTRVCRWRVVWPKYVTEQQRHLNEYTTQDLRAFRILSLKVKSWDRRDVERKTNLILRWG